MASNVEIVYLYYCFGVLMPMNGVVLCWFSLLCVKFELKLA